MAGRVIGPGWLSSIEHDVDKHAVAFQRLSGDNGSCANNRVAHTPDSFAYIPLIRG
jgi:hypothetical protein